jgi:hypothetical protein
MHADGRVIFIDVALVSCATDQPMTFAYRLQRVGAKPLDEIIDQRELKWTDLSEDSSAARTDDGAQIRAHCGAGTFDGDGFVALTSAKDGHLIWIAFFGKYLGSESESR